MKQKLLYITEAKILFIGLFLSILLLLGIGYFALIDIEIAKILGLVFFIHIFGGRAAGVGFCIMNGFSPIATISYNFYLEILIVCFAYSIFVLTTNNFIQVIWVKKLMGKLADKAIEQKDRIQSFGWVGLFIFVMLPLPITGPVVGSVIGYILRISLVRNFSAICSGTLAAIIVWFFCFDFLEQRFHVIQYIFIGIVIILLFSHHKAIIKFFFEKKK